MPASRLEVAGEEAAGAAAAALVDPRRNGAEPGFEPYIGKAA
jgi:hypothetical protein